MLLGPKKYSGMTVLGGLLCCVTGKCLTHSNLPLSENLSVIFCFNFELSVLIIGLMSQQVFLCVTTEEAAGELCSSILRVILQKV